MTRDELKTAAIDCLGKAFKSESTPPAHIIQAAVDVLKTPDDPPAVAHKLSGTTFTQ